MYVYTLLLCHTNFLFLEADNTTYTTWMKNKENCKVKGYYPLGNLTLSNITMACSESNHNNTSPRWIGVVHEVNKTEDQGNECLI